MTDKKISEDMQQQLNQLQMMEQNLQNFTMQRQMMQSQLMEVESALEEMKDSKEAYKIVGNIMVSADKKDLQSELEEKQELLKRRVETLEGQEKKLRDKAESLQQDLLKSLK